MKKTYKIVQFLIRIAIVLLAVFKLTLKNYSDIMILVITFILTFFDSIIKKILKLELPEKLNFSILIFIFASQILGSVLDFYGKFLWWDTMLHTLSGIIFFYVGFSIIEQINNKVSKFELNKKIIILFAICFALATGVIWEIIEYGVDTFLGQNMQVSKNFYGQKAIRDTMIDLISVTVGSIFIMTFELIKSKKVDIQKNNN